MDIARDHVKSQTFNNPDIACVFLIGSLTKDALFIGDATDIDLVFIHNTEPASAREVIPLADNYHLDILHFPRRIFNQPKDLRTDPWMGCLFCENPFVLYDTYHFYDFIRAGVFSNFFSPLNSLARSQYFYTRAREGWSALHRVDPLITVDSVHAYLQILWSAGNAIACLVGKPLPERSFLTKLEEVTTYLGRPGLASGLRDLYAIDDYSSFGWEDRIDMMKVAFQILAEKSYCPPEYSPARFQYYRSAILSYQQNERPDEALWVLLWTWSNVMHILPRKTAEVKDLKDICQEINLSQDTFPTRLEQLDTYLDALDTTIDDWKNISGIL
ncbi:MAG: hypothetical protein XD73_0774 [Anaerolinea thermophila]|uniref:Uncharacterized protein n=1 Tax=Anaerolinea thermophila TaxID=167964 RepID=A0A101FXU3_9CHLR|nr:MAG: hypothetical protein XD73_0774 [Anaerolinea thermophila]